MFGVFDLFTVTLGTDEMVGSKNKVVGKVNDTNKHEDGKEKLNNSVGVSLRIGDLSTVLKDGVADHIDWFLI